MVMTGGLLEALSLLSPFRFPFDMVSSLSVFVVISFGVFIFKVFSRQSRLPFPPGPRGLPLLGNVRDIPIGREWEAYTQWAKAYGSIVSVHILGQRVVLLNTPELCHELFEVSSSQYSHRPFAPMLDMMGYAQWLVGLLQPGQQWSMCRKLLGQKFGPQAVQQWRSYEVQEVHRLLGKLLRDPENFYRHIDRAIVGTFMRVLYDYRISESGDDDFVTMHDKSLRETSKGIASGAYIVNLFPSFRHIPQWLNVKFKREAEDAFFTGQKVLHEPMERIKENMAKGVGNASYVSSLLEEGGDEFAIKQTAATAYNAGVTGTNSALLTMILVTILFPEAQSKAKQEIDDVIGNSRLPEFKDRVSLPYTEAFVKELFRWAPPAPVGLPRRLSQDDVVQGYFIPAGSLIMSNMWAILHDESQYPKPFDFIPERHLNSQGFCSNPTLEGFGFGKRICPGRHLVDNFVWLAVVSILATMDIQKKVDKDGQGISPKFEYTSGLFSAPRPFEAIIKPRSHALAKLIQQANDPLL